MIVEAIRFIDNFEEVPLEQISTDRQINTIAQKYDKIAIINATIDNNSLKMKEPILLASELNDELQDFGFKDLRGWLNNNANEGLLKKLEFGKYIDAIPHLNKCIGSRNGLLSFSLFHFRLRRDWILNPDYGKHESDVSEILSDVKLNNKIDKFKFSESFIIFLEKEIGDELTGQVEFLNSKEGVRGIYYDFSNWLIRRISEFLKEKISSVTDNNKQIESLLKLFDNIHIYLNLNDEIGVLEENDIVEELHRIYLTFNLPLQNPNRNPYIMKDGECPICGKTGKIGVPSAYNNLNWKIPFIKHTTRQDSLNIRICIECMAKFSRFEKFIRESNINFFPLIIGDDKREEEIRYLKNSDNLSFFSVLKHVFDMVEEDELDFILLHQQGDVLYYDYVNNFRLNLGESRSYLYPEKINLDSKEGLKKELINILGMRNTYFFGDIKFPRGFDSDRKYLIYKYREKLFDIIYRNKNTLTDRDIKEIITVLLDHRIKNGEAKCPYYKKSHEKILLDIYLNSNLFVNNPGKLIKTAKGGNKNMLEEIRGEKDEIIENGKLEINSDEKFGYYLGQTIYYLIKHSEAKDKMRLLKPIIDCRSKESLQRTIAEKYVDRYAHTLSDYKDFKHAVLSETLDYLQSKFESTFDKIKVAFYVGFFDGNIYFEKRGGD